MKGFKSLILGVLVCATTLQGATYKFIEKGRALDVEQCGKYFGNLSETVPVGYTRGITACALIGTREITGGKYHLETTFTPADSCQFFIGGFYDQGFMVSSYDKIKFNNGQISGKGSLKFSGFEAAGQLKLSIQSNGKKVTVSINDKELVSTTEERVVKGGFFGWYASSKTSPIVIDSFTLKSEHSNKVLPQSLRAASRMNEAHWSKVHNGNLAAGKCDVLFIGDSITDAFDGDAGFVGENHNRSGKPVWDTAFGKMRLENAGIGSDRTQQVLWRVKRLPFDKLKPKHIVLVIGINNIGSNHTAKNVFLGIKEIVKELRQRSPRSKILLLTTFPTKKLDDGHVRRQASNKMLKSYNWGKQVKVVDMDKPFAQKNGTMTPAYTYDGYHLSTEGFRVWAETIVPLLK